MLIAKRSLKYANLLPRIEFALLLMREKHKLTKILSHLENPVKNFKSLIYNLYFICTEFVRGPNIQVCVVYGKPRIFLTQSSYTRIKTIPMQPPCRGSIKRTPICIK